MSINELTIYQTIYTKLDAILGIQDLIKHNTGFNLKLKSSGYMDLTVEILAKNPDYIRISITHYGELNGDLMADPDMEIKIYTKHFMAEALSYQNDYMGIYQRVCTDHGNVNHKLKKDLNQFLNTWLNNLKAQGFKRVVKTVINGGINQ